MTSELTCGWDTSTGDTEPTTCGRPAKARAGDRPVCGVHARSARAHGYEVASLPGPDVRVGQVWADNDPRIAQRHVQVTEVDETHATVVVCTEADQSWATQRTSRIRLDRFRPTRTGYRLISDAPQQD